MILESEIFYNYFSSEYEDYSKKRKVYTSSIDDIIINRLKNIPLISVLDIGGGTGRRTSKISSKLNTHKVVILERSEEMLKIAKQKTNYICIQANIAESNVFQGETFDALLCLWNVLGHLNNQVECISTFRNIRTNMGEESLLFLDVNNRYNVSQYGLFNVIRNIFKDLVHDSFLNGNFIVTFFNKNRPLTTVVHLFNPFEIKHLIYLSGLKIEKELFINYSSGKVQKTCFTGQLFYILKKNI